MISYLNPGKTEWLWVLGWLVSENLPSLVLNEVALLQIDPVLSLMVLLKSQLLSQKSKQYLWLRGLLSNFRLCTRKPFLVWRLYISHSCLKHPDGLLYCALPEFALEVYLEPSTDAKWGSADWYSNLNQHMLHQRSASCISD